MLECRQVFYDTRNIQALGITLIALTGIPGTDPARLIAQLSPDPETAERTLRDLIAQAQQLAGAPPDDADHG